LSQRNENCPSIRKLAKPELSIKLKASISAGENENKYNGRNWPVMLTAGLAKCEEGVINGLQYSRRRNYLVM